MENNQLQLFENKEIRTAWDEEKEEWYFSVVDVVGVLTDQDTQRGASNYWAKLKQRLKEEGADQLLTNCQQLKLKSHKDGKRYLTDVATTEQLLRIIQSIPSPKAEPFKLWLAEVGRKRIEETIDPELTIDRALETVPFPVSWTVKMKKKQKETQDILSYHTQAAGCSDKARAKASGGRQPIEECGRTGL